MSKVYYYSAGKFIIPHFCNVGRYYAKFIEANKHLLTEEKNATLFGFNHTGTPHLRVLTGIWSFLLIGVRVAIIGWKLLIREE